MMNVFFPACLALLLRWRLATVVVSRVPPVGGRWYCVFARPFSFLRGLTFFLLDKGERVVPFPVLLR